MTDLKKRVITGIVGMLLLLGVLYLGGATLKIVLFFVSSIMIYEMTRALRHVEIQVYFPILIGSSFLMMVSLFTNIPMEFSLFAGALAALIYFVFDREFKIENVGYTFFILVYIPYFFYHIDFLEKTPFFFLVLIIAFGTDTFAYFVGCNIGKTKFVPQISPNKSLEGAIGGVVGSVLLSIGYLYVFKTSITFLGVIFLIFASICSQIGDLTASKIKRICGIKDYGKILPGHGGFMDRLDSVIPVIPLVYALYHFVYM